VSVTSPRIKRIASSRGTHPGSGKGPVFRQAAISNVLSMDSKPQRGIETLEETLSSALLAEDDVLDGIVHEIDQISNTLKSGGSDPQALTNALQRAVLCAIKQALMDRELRSLALTDDLTGLYNRRGFLASATHHLRLAKRNDEALLLFFADVNNLKEINDSYGHHEGDHALIRTADAIEQTFRDSDILARLSGDEFAVLAAEASSENEDAIRSRLQRNLKKPADEESAYELSISIGVARFDPNHAVTLAQLMGQADRAMYEAKRSHRVCVSKR
jgi:two-component system, cell cycle response regulator